MTTTSPSRRVAIPHAYPAADVTIGADRVTTIPAEAIPAGRSPIRFTPARFADIEGEIAPLWRAHWLEIGEDRDRVPLDPDLAKYRALEAAGCLEITAARREGELLGYVFSVVTGHLHYASTLCAHQDLRYLRPDARGPRVAIRLGEAHERQLRARGVVKAIANVKVRANRDGRLFEHLGWRPFEVSYAKVL